MLDETDRAIINGAQGGFPVCERPYAELAARLGLDEAELLERLQRLLDDGVLDRFGPLYRAEAMGGTVTLAAMAVPAERFDEVARFVNGYPEVAHNYRRDHDLNMWFVVASDRPRRVKQVLAAIEAATGLKVYNMPRRREFHLGLRLEA